MGDAMRPMRPIGSTRAPHAVRVARATGSFVVYVGFGRRLFIA